MKTYGHKKAFLVKGNLRIPISFHRNLTTTEVRSLTLKHDQNRQRARFREKLKNGQMDASFCQMEDPQNFLSTSRAPAFEAETDFPDLKHLKLREHRTVCGLQQRNWLQQKRVQKVNYRV